MAARCRLPAVYGIKVQIFDWLIGQPEEALVRSIRVAGLLVPGFLELGRYILGQCDARVWCEQTRGPGGAREGRQILGVYRDPCARAREQYCGGEADRPTANDSKVTFACGQRHLHR